MHHIILIREQIELAEFPLWECIVPTLHREMIPYPYAKLTPSSPSKVIVREYFDNSMGYERLLIRNNLYAERGLCLLVIIG
jgi:hypothetical protein